MNEIIIVSIIAVVQIFLSVNLIIRQKNVYANISEIISSTVLFFILRMFFLSEDVELFQCSVLILAEYIALKIFLVIFMVVARYYSFYKIKKVCNSKKKKINKKRLRLLIKFNKSRYWPRLKLGIPGKADRKDPATRVKFDSKGFPEFKYIYTVELCKKDCRKSRQQHFYIANKILYIDILSKSRIRAKFTEKEIEQIAMGVTPEKYTWHHHQNAGVLQLVEYNIHSKTSHIGGYSIWGKK